MALDAIDDLKAQGKLGFSVLIRLLMISAMLIIALDALKSIIKQELKILIRGNEIKEGCRKVCVPHFRVLRSMQVVLRIIFCH